MKKIIIGLLAIAFVACNPTAKLPSIQEAGDLAFNQADYQKAYTQYAEYAAIAEANSVELSNAMKINYAQTCTNLGKVDEAKALYDELLLDDSNTKLLAEYAQFLQREGLINDELALWNKYSDKINDPSLKKLMTERLIFLENSKENYAAVIETYTGKGDHTLAKEAELVYIKALENTKKGHAAAKACNSLLKTYPYYTEALEWKARYYYNKAENKYQYEMNKYNKKKNNTTYAYLRRELKKVSGDFRISRDVFLKLRKQDAANKSYIRHLKNIYLRLDMKAEAAKMDKLLK